MVLGETFHKGIDSLLVETLGRLVNLENLAIVFHLVASDGKWDNHLNLICLAEFGKILDLIGIQRAKDDITILGALVEQSLAYIRIYRYIPCVDIN